MLVYFTYHYLVQSVGGSELIREGLLEEADIILSLKHENERITSPDPNIGRRIIKETEMGNGVPCQL